MGNDDYGPRKRPAKFPCQTCASYGPRPDGGPWGGECINPASDAMFWEDGGFWFTAPNDTCVHWEVAHEKVTA